MVIKLGPPDLSEGALALAGLALALLAYAASRALSSAAAPSSASGASRKRRFAVSRADSASLAPGKMAEIVVDGRRVLLVRTAAGRFRAMGTQCPHYNLPLHKGVVAGERVMCYAHAACFDSATGDIEDGPSLDRVPVYALTQEGEGADAQLFVELPDGELPIKAEPAFCAARPGSAEHVVVVGAGPAAQGCVETLRAEGFDGRITMLTREATAFAYDRVKLSKAMGAPAARLRPEGFYERLGVAVRAGAVVTQVRVPERAVVLATGETIGYTKLLCATGGPARTYRADRSEPGPPPIPGAELGNIFPMRDIEHAQAISAALERAGAGARVVIVGSSFIGMEAASYLLSMRLVKEGNVHVVGMEEFPMERVLGREVGAMLLDVGRAKGVSFRMQSVVQRFVAGEGGAGAAVARVVLGPPPARGAAGPPAPSETLDADLVILGVGIVPATEYLRGAQGVALQEGPPGGVRVDAFLNAGPEDVFAAGDIAYLPYAHGPEGAGVRVRIEHWDVAIDQGRAAARNMLGGALRAPYAAVPFFWTSVFGRQLRSAGYCHKFASDFAADKGDEVIVRGDLKADGRAVIFYVVAGRVASVVTCNADPEAAAASELLRLRRMPPPDLLRAASAATTLVAELARVTRDIEEAAAAAAAAAADGAAGSPGAEGASASQRKRRGTRE